MKTVVALICVVALAAPAAAQARRTVFTPVPPASNTLRPFFVVSGENFLARETFNAVFGQSIQVMWGGGLQMAFRNGLYVDFAVSRFAKTGDRAFFFNGQGFALGIPLAVELTPIEATIGRRFTLRSAPRAVPYVGVGAGWYIYRESSDTDEFTASHAGGLAVGGVEFRVSRLVRLSGDLQYTYIPGIIGNDGFSKDAGESDLGGLAARVRVIFGR